MKLYKQDEDKIVNIRELVYNGNTFDLNNIQDITLNSMGYYRLLINSLPDTRYYTSTRTAAIVGTVYEITYIPAGRPLADVQHRMAKDLRTAFDSLRARPLVDTGLGFSVYGGIADIEELVMWKDYAETEIIDADGEIQAVTGVSYTTIATAIKDNRRTRFQLAKTKVAEIKALTTLQECIDYEHEAYDSIEEIVDEFGIPTGAGTHIVVRYKNNVTDWM